MILAYAISCLLLAAAFAGLRVWPLTRSMAAQLRANFAVIGNKAMSDDEKERALRTGSLAVLRETVRLTAALAATCAAAAAPVVLAERAGWLTYQGFVVFSIQPLVVVATIAAFYVLERAGHLARRSW